MPNFITPPELADSIANQMGIYGAHPEGELEGSLHCNCRVCFVSSMTLEIREAAANEIMLSKTHPQSPASPQEGAPK